MNLKNAKQYLSLVQAAAEGKTIQVNEAFKHNPYWVDISNPSFDMEVEFYRIKPESKLRPWTAEEVPVGALLRANFPNATTYVIVANPTGGIRVLDCGGPYVYTFDYAFCFCKHSTDGGKTWLPCGTLTNE